MERNADRVWGWSYAPLFQNLNSFQWSPDLIAYTADQTQTFGSVSYDVQRLLGAHEFTSTLPATTTDDSNFGPAYWVAGENSATGTYYLKAAVYNSTEDVPFSVAFDGAGGEATLTVLTAPDGYSYNYFDEVATVTTTSTLTAGEAGAFTFSLPNLSVAVLAAAAAAA